MREVRDGTGSVREKRKKSEGVGVIRTGNCERIEKEREKKKERRERQGPAQS